MIKEFIPYKEALILKKLGFDDPCFTSYDDKGKLNSIWNLDYEDIEDEVYMEDTPDETWCFNSTNESNYIASPLWQQAFEWFRNKHNLYSWIKPIFYNDLSLGYNLIINDLIVGAYTKYDKAQLASLQKLIKMVLDENSSINDV